MHILNADCLIQAVELAADPEYAGITDKYEAWDTPKLYLHLYEEGQIVFPVDEPMENAGGLTPFQAAEMAYDCHKSQHIWFKLQRGELPTNDCRIFGLYRSTV